MTSTEPTRAKALKAVFEELQNVKAALADARRTQSHPPEHQRLNRAQLDAFFAVVRSSKPISMKELTESLHVTPGAVTQVIDSLVNLNMLKRSQCEDDRRSVVVELTAEARAKLASIRKFMTAQLTPLFDNLTVEELHQLTGLLSKLRTH